MIQKTISVLLMTLFSLMLSCGGNDTKPKTDNIETKKDNKEEKTSSVDDGKPQSDEPAKVEEPTDTNKKVDVEVKTNDSKHVVNLTIDVNNTPVKEEANEPIVLTVVATPAASDGAPETQEAEDTSEPAIITGIIERREIVVETPSTIVVTGANVIVQEEPPVLTSESNVSVIDGYGDIKPIIATTVKIEGGLEGENMTLPGEDQIIEFDMYNPAGVLGGENQTSVEEESVFPPIGENAFTKLIHFFESFFDTMVTAGSNVDQTQCVPREYRSKFPTITDIPLMIDALKSYKYKDYSVIRGTRVISYRGLDCAEALGTKDNMCITYEQLMDVYVAAYSVLLTYVGDAHENVKSTNLWIAANQVAQICQSSNNGEGSRAELLRKHSAIKAQMLFLQKQYAKRDRKKATQRSAQ